MRQRDLSRLRIASPAHSSHVGDGVVRRTKRTRVKQGGIGAQLARHGMDLCGLQRFVQRERRKNGGKPFGQHRLACAGRSDHNHIMPASRRGFLRPLFFFLLLLLFFMFSCPWISLKSASYSLTRALKISLVFTLSGSIFNCPSKKAMASFKWRMPITSMLFTIAPSFALEKGKASILKPSFLD